MIEVVIFDADIISMFAKAGAVDVLIETLSKFRLCITPRIKDEISVPLQFGYSFPEIIFNKLELIFPTEEESSLYQTYHKVNQTLGKGELEAISIAKSRKCIFAANDRKALEFAVNEGLTVINVHSILKVMLEKEILNINELKVLIGKIEEADNTRILGKDMIFEDMD